MKLSTKFATVMALAFGSAGIANAETEFEAAFQVNHAHAAPAIYAELEQTAKDVCEQNYPRSKYQNSRPALLNACKADLIEQVVNRLDRADVTAYHSAPDYDRTLMAALSRLDTQ
ncbi:MAG: hypothetical protein AAFO63_08000 [Pseudomonadota bacterium]